MRAVMPYYHARLTVSEVHLAAKLGPNYGALIANDSPCVHDWNCISMPGLSRIAMPTTKPITSTS